MFQAKGWVAIKEAAIENNKTSLFTIFLEVQLL